MDTNEIRARLELVVMQLGQMHERVVVRAAYANMEPLDMLLPTGEPALAPIFIAQANALAALAYLQR